MKFTGERVRGGRNTPPLDSYFVDALAAGLNPRAFMAWVSVVALLS
jgi:hypothetical protein